MTHPLHEFFSKIRLFSQLNTDELNELLRAVQPIEVSANTRVFSTGDPGDGAFVIESGRVDITLADADGPLVVASLGPGEVFGEIALLDGGTRSADATTAAPTKLLRIDKEEFDFLRRNHRSVAFKIIRPIAGTVSKRIRLSNQRIARLLTDDEASRITLNASAGEYVDNRKSFLQRLFSSWGD